MRKMKPANCRLTSDLVPFTIRYELEKRHNIELMAHYGDDDGTNTEDSMSSDEDSNDENVYFDPKPRRINFDDLEYENCVANEIDTKVDNVPKRKRNKLLGDEATKKFTCDICKKFFEKRWALNSHMLLHSGYVWYSDYNLLLCGIQKSFVSVISRSAALIRRVQSNMLTGKCNITEKSVKLVGSHSPIVTPFMQ